MDEFLIDGLNSPELKRIEFTLSRMNHEASVCQLKSLLLQKVFFFGEASAGISNREKLRSLLPPFQQQHRQGHWYPPSALRILDSTVYIQTSPRFALHIVHITLRTRHVTLNCWCTLHSTF